MEERKAKHSKRRHNSLTRTLILIICIVTMIISGYHIIVWYRENKKSQKVINKIQNTIKIENDETVVDFEELKKQNSNTVAWLKVEGTEIEYPVVKGKDNSFYLTHSFDDSYNNAGWIFADYNNTFDGEDKHIVIYGHNRRDGSMFGSLKNVLEKDWCSNEKNRTITFITEEGNIEYQVFSVYKIENEDYYITTKFNSNEEFEKFITTIKNRSIYDFGTDIKKTDKVLTLSTCANNNKYRVVLHAKQADER